MARLQTNIVILLTLSLIGCVPRKTENRAEQSNSIKTSVDSSIISILPYDTTLYWIFKDCNKTELSTLELEDIENIIMKCIDEYNSEQEKQFTEINNVHPEYKFEKKDFIIDLKRYKRQYIAVTNKIGEKEVWINFFCETMKMNWKEDIVVVMDGGNCFFNLKINMTTKKYFDLTVNGAA
jgi:hypothetical protein